MASSSPKEEDPSPSPPSAADPAAVSVAVAASDPPPPPPSSSSRRLPPPCWTHDETLALIDCYREKWYGLRRGNLRASHWQEVADAVVARCLRRPAASPKTSVQCRHKIEKLRKRYRAERHRSLSHDPSVPPSSTWPYFRNMDAMEHGGAVKIHNQDHQDPVSDDDESSDEEDPRRRGSIHRLMSNGSAGIGGLRFTIPKAVRSKIKIAPPAGPSRVFKSYGEVRMAAEEMTQRLEKRRRVDMRERDGVGEMVSALKMLGDGFMRMEQMKMEMAREIEKVRMEMELKRTEMILDSQRRIVDSFVKGFFGGGSKRGDA